MAGAERQLLAAAARGRGRVLGEAVAAHGKRVLREADLRGRTGRRPPRSRARTRGTRRPCPSSTAYRKRKVSPVRSRVSNRNSATSTPVSWWRRTRPARQFSRAWTVMPLRRASGVAVVDGDEAVDVVPVGAHDVLRLPAGELAARPDAYPLVQAESVQAAVGRRRQFRQQLLESSGGLHQRAVRTRARGRCVAAAFRRRTARAAGSRPRPAAAGSPPVPARRAATRGAAAAGRPAASNSGW